MVKGHTSKDLSENKLGFQQVFFTAEAQRKQRFRRVPSLRRLCFLCASAVKKTC